MRLIDADDFIKKFSYAKANTKEENLMCAVVRRMIKEQPTAFDVDKILKELVKQKKIANKKMNESDDTYSMSYYDGFSSGLAIAIGIVKGGGIE